MALCLTGLFVVITMCNMSLSATAFYYSVVCLVGIYLASFVIDEFFLATQPGIIREHRTSDSDPLFVRRTLRLISRCREDALVTFLFLLVPTTYVVANSESVVACRLILGAYSLFQCICSSWLLSRALKTELSHFHDGLWKESKIVLVESLCDEERAAWEYHVSGRAAQDLQARLTKC